MGIVDCIKKSLDTIAEREFHDNLFTEEESYIGSWNDEKLQGSIDLYTQGKGIKLDLVPQRIHSARSIQDIFLGRASSNYLVRIHGDSPQTLRAQPIRYSGAADTDSTNNFIRRGLKIYETLLEANR